VVADQSTLCSTHTGWAGHTAIVHCARVAPRCLLMDNLQCMQACFGRAVSPSAACLPPLQQIPQTAAAAPLTGNGLCDLPLLASRCLTVAHSVNLPPAAAVLPSCHKGSRIFTAAANPAPRNHQPEAHAGCDSLLGHQKRSYCHLGRLPSPTALPPCAGGGFCRLPAPAPTSCIFIRSSKAWSS
jgi:hypothetical protein